MLWPHDMAILYPFPTEIALWQLAGSILLLIAVTAGVWRFRQRLPYLAVGWFWFLVTLLPVIGLIQVGGQSHADRYTYLPFTGLFIVVVWGVSDLCGSLRQKEAALTVLAALTVAACAVMSWQQLGYWRNNVTLFRHTLAVTSGNYLILNNYGIALNQENGDAEGAIQAYQEALRVWPKSSFSHNNLGAVYLTQGRYAEAMEHFQEALRLNPQWLNAQINIGRVLAKTGRPNEAIQQFEKVLAQDPTLSDAHLQLAILLIKAGRIDEARPHYEAMLKLDPSSAKGPINVAVELATAGRMEEAGAYFQQAVTIEPNSVEANFNMGVFLAKQNRLDEAAGYFYHVLQIKPDSEMARSWLRRIGRL
jgi:protein O-mannosyl-transferase